MKVKNKRFSLFLKICAVNIIILIIPLAISLLAYFTLSDALVSNTFALNRAKLEKAAEEVEESMAAASAYAKYIATKTVNDGLVYLTEGIYKNPSQSSSAIARADNLMDIISTSKMYNRSIHSAYVFLSRGWTVISPFVSGVSIDDFYGRFNIFMGMELDEWRDKILYGTNDGAFYFPDGPEENVIYCVQSMPVKPTGEHFGAVAAVVSKRELQSIMEESLMRTRLAGGSFTLRPMSPPLKPS